MMVGQWCEGKTLLMLRNDRNGFFPGEESEEFGCLYGGSASMEVVTFELRCEGALKIQGREEKSMSPRLQYE